MTIKLMSVTTCLSFEADDGAVLDAVGEGAWRRFAEITAQTQARPDSVIIAMPLRWSESLQRDHYGQAVVEAQQRWNERGRRVTHVLLRSHADWAGAPLSLRMNEQPSYAGRICGARVSVLFPLSEVPRLYPDATTGSCMVTCDHIACERR
ncbi:hypothetical protein ACG02S_21090 [Roseateles sp. DC23W]|uniref:Uncharacterized protein n=1 Tax=Pelomonas dachongensis TaxID=3299029 RepID=A0ABW7EU82_9BURK